MNTALKLKFYYDHVLSTVRAEGESQLHKTITSDVVTRFVDPMALPKTSRIIDLGCGVGYFLDEMVDRGYQDLLGITLSPEDASACQAKGHRVERKDMNFLADRDESIDMLFCRHSLEHSPFPYITLLEYNRVLRSLGHLYIEVPSPDCDRRQEENRNHYSIFGREMWLELLKRTGFDVEWYDYEFPMRMAGDDHSYMERYYIFVCRRRQPVDIK